MLTVSAGSYRGGGVMTLNVDRVCRELQGSGVMTLNVDRVCRELQGSGV